MILLRSLNLNLSAAEQFVVNPANGLVEFVFRISWDQYKAKMPRIESLRKFLNYLLKQLRKFEEVVYFCQTPTTNQTQQSLSRCHLYDDYLKVTNNFKVLLKTSKKIRSINSNVSNKLNILKNFSTANKRQQEYLKKQQFQLKTLYQHNILELYKVSQGVEQGYLDSQLHKKCMANISYHENYKDNNTLGPSKGVSSKELQNKIVNGINVLKCQKLKHLSQEGAHSEILKGIYFFRIIKSVELDVVRQEPQKWVLGTEKKAELVVKKCHQINEASRNSFMNEIYFLHHIRNFQCEFLGKYFLEMKPFRQRSEKDPIYMKLYSQNLQEIILRCQSLSIKNRLSLAYKVSLAICFLSSNGIIHRDLKPHNIVVNSSLIPHLIDFGSSCAAYGCSSYVPYDKRLLTSKYIHVHFNHLPMQLSYIHEKMSKEEYEQHPLFDVYSFGRVLSFIMFGTMDPPHFEVIQKEGYSEIMKNTLFLCHSCLTVDPDDRPTMAEVTGYLGSLSKFYSCYANYFGKNIEQKRQKQGNLVQFGGQEG